MSAEYSLFQQQIASLRNLSLIFGYLDKSAAAMDTDALLRSEFVLIVSAFDNYLHDTLRRKLREDFFANNTMPDGITLPLSIIQLIRNETNVGEQKRILDSALKKVLEKDSFQSPKSVEYVMGLLGVKHLWKTVSGITGDSADHIRNTLSLIIHRRNQIAHEADIDFTSGTPRVIDLTTVSECRSFFEILASCIDAEI